MTFEFRIVGGNSGVHFRSREPAKWQADGYQADISADGRWTGANYHEHGRGVLAMRGQKVAVGDGKGQVEVLGSLGDPKALLAKIKPNAWTESRSVARRRRCDAGRPDGASTPQESLAKAINTALLSPA